MRDTESGAVIAFNGEIFNYRSLRAGLGGQAAFNSTGDTEVLLRGLAARGTAFFAELDGMFAVLLYDPRARRLIVARDPLGIKPLYYARTRAGGWIFASEVRAILQSGVWAGGLHAEGVLDYLRFGCLQEPDTLFSGIHAFPAGHFGVISADTPERMRTESFWPIEKIMQTPPPSGEVGAWHADVWRETMNEHLDADVKTGVFLSAGMDSTAILEAIPKTDRERVTAFTLAGELTSTDEGALAARTASNLGVGHQIVRLNEAEVLALLEPHGFVAVQSEKLSVGEQIALFRDATHIVAPHGASLTNLLHSRRGSVLELFQEGHGVRPDFFQLAMINGLDYLHALCPSSGPEQHIKVSREVIASYLARTL
jgi:asparagine synthase (glutamine-hydrolysing)